MSRRHRNYRSLSVRTRICNTSKRWAGFGGFGRISSDGRIQSGPNSLEESTGTRNPRSNSWTDKCRVLRNTLCRHRKRRALRRKLHSIRKGPKMQHGRCFGKFHRWVLRRQRNIRSRTCWNRHRLNLYIAYVQIRQHKNTKPKFTDGW